MSASHERYHHTILYMFCNSVPKVNRPHIWALAKCKMVWEVKGLSKSIFWTKTFTAWKISSWHRENLSFSKAPTKCIHAAFESLKVTFNQLQTTSCSQYSLNPHLWWPMRFPESHNFYLASLCSASSVVRSFKPPPARFPSFDCLLVGIRQTRNHTHWGGGLVKYLSPFNQMGWKYQLDWFHPHLCHVITNIQKICALWFFIFGV
jgi:hypothetical protein